MATTIQNQHLRTPPARRTIVKAAAWSVPVISASIAAPMAAASTTPLSCPIVTSAQFTAWNAALRPGQIGDAGTGTNTSNGWGKTVYWAGPAFPGGGEGGFLSIENNLARNASGSPLASFTLERVVPVESGLNYYIQFSALGDYANKSVDADRTYQKVEFLINDAVVWADATAAVDGLPGKLTKVNGRVDVQTDPLTVPAGATSVKIAYRFTLPAKPTSAQRSANDDIIVSVPRFVCLNA
jgi:hypothetical protein